MLGFLFAECRKSVIEKISVFRINHTPRKRQDVVSGLIFLRHFIYLMRGSHFDLLNWTNASMQNYVGRGVPKPHLERETTILVHWF